MSISYIVQCKTLNASHLILNQILNIMLRNMVESISILQNWFVEWGLPTFINTYSSHIFSDMRLLTIYSVITILKIRVMPKLVNKINDTF